MFSECWRNVDSEKRALENIGLPFTFCDLIMIQFVTFANYVHYLTNISNCL